MNKARRYTRASLVFALMILAFGVILTLNVNIGSKYVTASPLDIFKILLKGHPDGGGYEGAAPEVIKTANSIWKVRLPRILAAAVLGGALSLSGYLLQTFFRNPIAGPYVLGISSGAKLLVGVMLIFVFKRATGMPFWIMMAAAFAGSMLVTGVVLLFAGKMRSMASLLVTGIMIGSICTAITDFLITFGNESDIANLHTWSMGSFSAISWQNLGACAAVIFVAALCAFLLCKPISAYQLGEEYARSMGVNVKLFRVALIGLSSVLSACVTALSGPISFVGVAVPHITKLLFGTSKPILIIPGCFLLGGVFCMLCDLIARTLFSPTELAISTVTAVFGAPVVIALMLSRQKEKTHE
ncbi:MAG: iron ABC transporter permease [Clostridia bacterium]|nr:iron ABC transporter permease [Clostridia bacterium]